MPYRLSATRIARHAFAVIALAAVGPLVHAAGTVGTGVGTCTEAAFDAALAGGGAVTFNCGGPATITFTSTKSISVGTTITGSAGIALDGGGTVRLFNVTGGGLTLANLTLANGHDTMVNFGAAAIEASANVSITDSTISGHHTTNGGCPAIVISGATLTITRSTITGNVNAAAATGHAVCGNNTATLVITNSTFAGNTGGAVSTSGIATITNSTIAGNSSTGAGNSGGVAVFGANAVVTLRNTIVANNTDSGQCQVTDGAILDGGGNLQFPDAGCGATIAVGDPLLGALASNGGPTQTMAIATGSPAIDAAVPANCPATDQRGQGRTDGDGNGSVVCDIGAFEAPTVVIAPPVFTAVPALIPSLLALLGLFIAALGAGLVRRRGRGRY